MESKNNKGFVSYTPIINNSPVENEKFTNGELFLPRQSLSDITIEPYKPEYTSYKWPPEKSKKDDSEPTPPLKTKGTIQYKSKDIDVGNLKGLIDLLSDAGISLRITSGTRPGAKTSSGKTSWHDSGDAIDITPIEGQTYDDLKRELKANPHIIEYMKAHGLGIIDETSQDMLNRTGGTGAHWHIGKDQLAIKGLEKILMGRQGMKLKDIRKYKNGNFVSYQNLNLLNEDIKNITNTFSVPLTEDPPFDATKKIIDNSGGYKREYPNFADWYQPEEDNEIEEDNEMPNFENAAKHFNKKIYKDNINYIYKTLMDSGFTKNQTANLITQIIFESGGDPHQIQNNGKGPGKGLIQWENDRYQNYLKFKIDNIPEGIDPELYKQVQFLIHEIKDQKSWTHGGENTGYMEAKDAFNEFFNENDLYKLVKSATLAYVRPKGKHNEVTQRWNFIQKALNL